jgi:hypothetical protein
MNPDAVTNRPVKIAPARARPAHRRDEWRHTSRYPRGNVAYRLSAVTRRLRRELQDDCFDGPSE